VSEKQEQPDLTVRFHCLPPPTDDDVEQLDARIVRRTARVLGCRDAALVADPELDPLAHAVAEAVQPPTLTEPATDPRRARRRCAFLDGFSLHADTPSLLPTPPPASGSPAIFCAPPLPPTASRCAPTGVSSTASHVLTRPAALPGSPRTPPLSP